MTFMRWNKNYMTGIPAIDEQHQGLVNLINQAAPILLDDTACHHDEIETLLNNLLQYADVHFKTEHDIMIKTGIDSRHLKHHVQLHNDFARQVAELRQQFNDQKSIQSPDLLKFLSNWLVFHMLDEDQRMARQLNAISNGDDPAAVYDQIEGKQPGDAPSVNETLIAALVDLFALLTEQNHLLAQKNQAIEQANNELKQHRLSLETQIQQRTAELAIAKEVAEQASLAKSRFLGVISHELLTPLHVITGFIHLLNNESLTEPQQEKVDQINQSAEQLTKLLKEVIHYARLDVGEVDILKTPFSPISIIRYLSDWAEKQCRKKNLQLHVMVDDALPILVGDEKLILQTLEILISNAIKFTQQGSITLQVQVLQKTETQAQIAFDVIDTGMGIPLERQSDLFHPFEQLDNSIARRHGGIGLGLVVCAKLVKLMQGHLEFDSAPDNGTRFRITLNLPIDQSELLTNMNLAGLDDQRALDLINQLQTLNQMLEENNLQARNLYYKLEPWLKDIVPATELADLSRQIRDYNFEQALIQIKKIMNS